MDSEQPRHGRTDLYTGLGPELVSVDEDGTRTYRAGLMPAAWLELTEEQATELVMTGFRMFGRDPSGRPVSMTERVAAWQEWCDAGLLPEEQAQAFMRAMYRVAGMDRHQ